MSKGDRGVCDGTRRDTSLRSPVPGGDRREGAVRQRGAHRRTTAAERAVFSQGPQSMIRMMAKHFSKSRTFLSRACKKTKSNPLRNKSIPYLNTKSINFILSVVQKESLEELPPNDCTDPGVSSAIDTETEIQIVPQENQKLSTANATGEVGIRAGIEDFTLPDIDLDYAQGKKNLSRIVI
ncbi:hypothetical protein NDU88_007150 [Pleurodeles waltl]|uniref:Uncharacterized protein n=1 Tax=Pleurodeles waltl TaxID=8319 RepID=A0AAV7US42_PLEWA|nr:hypothetical protein NDU88_007150 [Pleurodeles waltl]